MQLYATYTTQIDALLRHLPTQGDLPDVGPTLLRAYRAGELGPCLADWVEHLLVLSRASRERLYHLDNSRL